MTEDCHKEKPDSITGVNPQRTHGFGIWGNRRVVMGVRVDEKLKLVFTEVAKAKFGSTCNPIESFMAAIVGVFQNEQTNSNKGVNPSTTINIGEIKIERNLRERRKLTNPNEDREENNIVRCEVGECENVAVGKGIYVKTGEVLRLCKMHLTAYCNSSLWGIIS